MQSCKAFLLIFFFNSNLFVNAKDKLPIACAIPDSVGITVVTQTNATVIWQSVNNAMFYHIRYRETGTQAWFLNQVTLNGKTLTGLIPSTEYEVQVQSVCNLSQTQISDFSSSVNFTTVADTVLLRGPYLQMVTASSIVVRWRTNTPVDSKVYFGTNNSFQNFVYDSTPVKEHIINLPFLNHETKYYYAIATSAEILQGDSLNFFITSPLKHATDFYRFWITGDIGKSSVAQVAVRDAFLKYATNKYPNLWLWLGDNAYEDGTDSEFQKNVFEKYPEQFKNIPVYPAPGNHDYANIGYLSEDAKSVNFPYFSIFSLPQNGEAGGVPSLTPKYYSFDYGNVHFVSIDTYGADNFEGSPMYKWLDDDLAANTLRWTIVYFHHPPYTMISHNSNNEIESIDVRKNLIPLFDKHHVDLVLSGHAHGNERSYLIKGHTGRSETFRTSMILNKNENEIIKRPPYKGTIYAVCGSSAQNIGTAQSEFPLRCMAYNDTLNNSSMVLDLHADTLKACYLSSEGIITDAFRITKSDIPYLPDTGSVFCTINRKTIELSFLKSADKNYSIQLINSLGQTLSIFGNEPLFEKNNYVTFELQMPDQNIAEGIYYMVVDDGNKKQTCKVVYLE